MKSITPIVLSQEGFNAFGDVIEARGQSTGINQNHTQRFDSLATVDGGVLSIFRTRPLALPIAIEVMERHPNAAQAFMPLSENPYLIVVAPKGGFDETLIKVFQAQPGQGVNYHAGTWHHYNLALNAPSDFLVIDRGGADMSCDEVNLKNPFLINL